MKLTTGLKAGVRRRIVRELYRRGATIQHVGCPGHDLDNYFNGLYKDQFQPESLSSKQFYNIGAGRFRHRYWTNVDLRAGTLSEGWSEEDIDFDISQNRSLSIMLWTERYTCAQRRAVF